MPSKHSVSLSSFTVILYIHMLASIKEVVCSVEKPDIRDMLSISLVRLYSSWPHQQPQRAQEEPSWAQGTHLEESTSSQGPTIFPASLPPHCNHTSLSLSVLDLRGQHPTYRCFELLFPHALESYNRSGLPRTQGVRGNVTKCG